jgi:hypothetical protein
MDFHHVARNITRDWIHLRPKIQSTQTQKPFGFRYRLCIASAWFLSPLFLNPLAIFGAENYENL